ncbi:MAG: sensor histidine kinase [Planctomycetota bacterium]
MEPSSGNPNPAFEEESHYCTAVESALESERRRIARELHDGLAQDLTALSLVLGAATSQQELRQAAELAGRACDTVRRQMMLLHPPPMGRDTLIGSLRALAERTTHETATIVTVDDRRLTRSPGAVGYDLLRVASEAIHNALHHGRARNIRISLRDTVDATDPEHRCLRLTITDDGRGFDPTTTKPRTDGTGRGLGFMRERIEDAGGIFMVRSTPGRGTRILVEVAAAADQSVIPDVWKMEVARTLASRDSDVNSDPKPESDS